MCKEVWCVGLELEGACLHKGGQSGRIVLNTLKGGRIEKKGWEINSLKRQHKLSQWIGVLKVGGCKPLTNYDYQKKLSGLAAFGCFRGGEYPNLPTPPIVSSRVSSPLLEGKKSSLP